MTGLQLDFPNNRFHVMYSCDMPRDLTYCPVGHFIENVFLRIGKTEFEKQRHFPFYGMRCLRQQQIYVIDLFGYLFFRFAKGKKHT